MPSPKIQNWLICALLCLCASLASCSKKPVAEADDFIRVMNTGKTYYEKGDAARAIETFQKAITLNPTHADAHLNLANACLLAGQSENAIKAANEAATLDANSAAPIYVRGCAWLRLSKYEEAVKDLEKVKTMDPSVPAVFFQLGQAHLQLKHFEDAVREFQAAVDIDADHPSAHYALSQALMRTGKQVEAGLQLELHQKVTAKLGGSVPSPASVERCIYTQVRVPFRLEQPAKEGIQVAFTDQTEKMFGTAAKSYEGPFGLLDINHRGSNDLFLLESGKGFRLLLHTNGAFQPGPTTLPFTPGVKYQKVLVGDLNNDHFEDLVVLGDKGSRAFKSGTNGLLTDSSLFSRLSGLGAIDGALVDLDFTGKLDLVAVSSTNDVRILRNLGNMYFKDITATSGVPANFTAVQSIAMDDWNNDDLMDLYVARTGQPVSLLAKQRGSTLTPTNPPTAWPSSTVLATGDLNNDLRTDLLVVTTSQIEVLFGGLDAKAFIPTGPGKIQRIQLFDYDNDGWMDVCTIGEKVRIWRNAGQAGFQEMTTALGLDKAVHGTVLWVAAADFDGDCDTDLLLGYEAGGVQLLRNDGGNANHQLKIRLMGNRSNASGLGIRIETVAGGWRTIRTVGQLPIEIGVGKNTQLDAMTVRWFDLAMNMVDLKVDCSAPLITSELVLPTGSCPYLYTWDGERFRFVTDILGASPVGLPVAEGVYIQADTDEYVWLGDERSFRPKGSNYVVQITEELREVLYLDEAALFVVDHPPGTEVHPTDKLVPGKPFPPSALMTLQNRQPLLSALDGSQKDVTALLQENDRKMVSPPRLRIPQLRGLAEPYSLTLDFGALDTNRPLVLAMSGWLRFGGGMANIAASQDASLPFPFPTLEVEVAGRWEKLDLTVGAPAGKTKTILVDLTGKLPPGAHRLRWTASFEIHWDRVALFEKADPAATLVKRIAPSRTDLHWRGFSQFEDLPPSLPLSPDYNRVEQKANWRITPTGWCTRYGSVDALLARTDDAYVMLNGGDECTLEFAATSLPAKTPGLTRDFFLFTDGWDKDADFHVSQGWRVDPLPYHGMNDQTYGKAGFQELARADWMDQYNTRWVSPQTFKHGEGKKSGR